MIWRDLAVEAYYSPAHKIGGDFGVVLSQGDELLNVIVCDVSGHGVGAALMAAFTQKLSMPWNVGLRLSPLADILECRRTLT